MPIVLPLTARATGRSDQDFLREMRKQYLMYIVLLNSPKGERKTSFFNEDLVFHYQPSTTI